MGDGGVACMPSQLVVERYSASEKLCVGEFVLLPEKKMREVEGSKSSSSLEKGSGKVEEKSKFMELEKGEFVPLTDRKRRGESDKVSESVENGELENGEFVPDEWQKVELDKGEIVLDRWKSRESERSDIAYARGHKVELEKGEFVPDSKRRKWDRERSPEGHYYRKELNRRSRSSMKLDGCSHERREDTGAGKYDNGNGKGHVKENGTKESSSGSWLKRHSLESKSSGSKRYNEVTERPGSKNRKVSKESNSSRSEHLDKSNKSTVESSKNSSNMRYSSSRHNGQALPHHGGFDKHVRSPGSNRTWNHEFRSHSPLCLERSSNSNRGPQRALGHLEKSPHGRSRHQDYRDRPPGFSGWSEHERSRNCEHKSKIPFNLEHPHYRGSSPDHHETGQGNSERKNRRFVDKTARKDSSGRNTSSHDLGSQPSNSTIDYPDKSGKDRSRTEKESRNHLNDSAELPPPPSPLPPPPLPSLLANTVQEELPSMEEDIDICDTPPHAGTTNADVGKWYYLDYFGIEQGPSRLMDLKQLIEEGFLLSDHLIKHSDSDRWVTVENATSPLLYPDLSSIASDAVMMMASPPQAPGNVISVFEDICNEKSILSLQLERDSDAFFDLKIDERIGALLDGYSITPGKELEAIGEALATSFVHVELDNWDHPEGFTRFQVRNSKLPRHQTDEETGQPIDYASKEAYDLRITALSEKEYTFLPCDSNEWFAGKWSCKGGDWKRNDDAVQDRSQKRKHVLNDLYLLCQMPKCGFEDPRWKLRDDLYHASCSKRLDLPSWAFSWVEEKSDGSTDPSKTMLMDRSCQARPLITRGTKGTVLPVIRINACVVKDHGSSTLEPRFRGKSKDGHSSKTIWSQSGVNERMLVTEATQPKWGHENYLHSDNKSGYNISIPDDHVCTKDELALNSGDWYYLDGAGHEQGPYMFSDLLDLVAKDTIMEHSSVFRKADNIWVPISTKVVASGSIPNQEHKAHIISSYSSLAPPRPDVDNAKDVNVFSSFHSSYPQFLGFMCGKLHELVMKSYKSREFAAAINGVLDPWINANQPKEIDMHFSYNSSVSKSSSVLAHELSRNMFWRSEEDYSGLHSLPGKHARLTFGESGEDYEMEEDLFPFQKNKYSFEDLCAEASFAEGINASFHASSKSWGLLNFHILARIFHFLKSDMKSLFLSAFTCKHWKMAVSFYKGISKYVDFSPAGPSCTDTLFQSVMSGYNKNMITMIILARCTNVSCSALEKVMKSFPGISNVDIRGCNQFRELVPSFQNVQWLQSQNSYSGRNLGDPYSKARSLKQITEKSYTMSKSLKESSSYLDSFDDTARFGSNGSHMDRKGFKNEMFKQGYYRKTKLLDARKSSGALSRDAQLKQLIRKKSENAFKKMEPLISNTLKSIIKENTFDFLIPKVEEIQDRMISGYYLRHGLNSVKDDIRLMCRNMMKYKKQFNTANLKRVISSFIQLVERLEKPKKSYEKDGEAKPHIDGSEKEFCSADAKSRKKQGKIMSDRRSSSRNANTSCGNGGAEYRGSTLDRGIKRSLSKLKKRYKDSESETSDDGDLFEEDAVTEGESTGSETESDLEFRTEAGMGNQEGYFILDDTTDIIEEREWGARMTKASLVPPVTRKYEVINQYLIVADESEVERKMRVTLPEDYDEKLREQSNGIEEMEIPEVKDYKPRKMLGEDVLEQEVYGIDPYTHNLLLDSMSKEMECSLTDMHHFIEEILLRTLNKQVRHFTGSGNAPIVYQLQPVIEVIKRKSEEDGDMCITKMCQALLKTMRSRSIENYVAYRKGLGVVCNKKDGFGVDDFVVEFLGEVYPAWKWYEKQDGIRSLQKDSKEPLPEFYNIYLERPKGDGEGYDLVVVDAMHKANYASRICHSCKPNCEAKVTAVDGHYQIGIYTREPIAYGEEITFDYNSVTESKDEYEASVCLCGSQVCRGSFLNLTGEDAFQNVLKECHGILDRHKLMLEACEANSVSEEDYLVLGRAGLGTCLLSGLPNWLIAYSAHLVRFINFERKKLPGEIVKLNVEEKMKYIPNYNPEDDKIDAEVQAEGVYNQRLQNMAITIDKVKYVMMSVFGDPKKAPPPLEKLVPDAAVSALWKDEGSLVNELLKSLAVYMEADALNSLKSKVRLHDPSGSDDIMTKLRKSLLWLRDQIRDLPCSQRCRNDAAADLIHMYAYTKYFFRVREYESFTSPPVYISPLDMGPKYMEMLGSGFQEYCKTYGKNYCLGQLIYWHNQTNPDPASSLSKSSRGCLALPDISSFYANNKKPLWRHVYGSKTLGLMLRRMEKQPQKPWPRDEIWEFKSSPKLFGSPMMDAVLTNRPLDNDMVHWLKNRPAMFQGTKNG